MPIRHPFALLCLLLVAVCLAPGPASAFTPQPGLKPAAETLALARWPEDEYSESLTLVAYLQGGSRLEVGAQVTNLGIGNGNGRYNLSFLDGAKIINLSDEVKHRFRWSAPPVLIEMADALTDSAKQGGAPFRDDDPDLSKRRGLRLRTVAGTEGQPGHALRFLASQPGFAVDLRVTAQTPLYRPGAGVFLVDGRRVELLIQMPRATVEGVVYIDGQRREVRGVGYVEHGRSNADPRRSTDRHLRLRYFGEHDGRPLTVLAFDAVTAPADGERRYGFTVVFDGAERRFAETGPLLSGQALTPDSKRPKNLVPAQFQIAAPGVSLEGKQTRRLERYAYLEHVSGFLRLILQRFVYPVAYTQDCAARLTLDLPGLKLSDRGWADCSVTIARP
mgnify:CR=1 FL=1